MASIITQISSGFESLNDDTHGLILEFVGKKSYYAYGAIDKRCNQIYLSKNLPKETFLYGYAPLSVIQEKYAGLGWSNRLSVGYGVLYYNRRDVLEWALLEQEEHPNILHRIFYTAVEVGRLDILNEIYDRSTEDQLRGVFCGILSLVARNGKLETLKWLDSRSYLDDYKKRRCALGAAEGGHLNILLWLQTKLSFDEQMKRDCATSAAKGGHLNILEWLHENNFSFDERLKRVCAKSAAEGGKLNILEWLNDNGCSFNERTFWIAALEGHIHVLEWLRDNNCPWDKSCYKGAAEGGHVYILEWLNNNECPRGDANLELYEQVLKYDVKVWLRNNGFSMLQYYDFEDEYEDEYESYYGGGDDHYYGNDEYDSY